MDVDQTNERTGRHIHDFGSPMDRTFIYPDMMASNIITRTVELRMCSSCDNVRVLNVRIEVKRIADWYYEEMNTEMAKLNVTPTTTAANGGIPLPPQPQEVTKNKSKLRQ